MIAQQTKRWFLDEDGVKWLAGVVADTRFAEVRSLIITESILSGNASYASGVLEAFEMLTRYSKQHHQEPQKALPAPFSHIVKEQSSFSSKS
jgi:hypothetical protein